MNTRYTDLSGDSRFKVGIELEKEDPSFTDSLVFGDWQFTTDCSLGCDGFELVSPILPLDLDKRDFLLSELERVRSVICADDSSDCGGHIHISDSKRNPGEILCDIAGYLPLLYAMYPSRCMGEYSRARTLAEYREDDNLKWKAITLHPKTVEVRIFSAPKYVETLRFRLDLLRYMLQHPLPSVSLLKERLQDSALSNIFLSVYSESKFNNLVGRLDSTIIKYPL